MNFGLVQIGFLLAVLGVAIPLIINFTFRARPRVVELGSIRFLREILERSRNRKRVMRWLLLTLRMACILLLAILFARPYFSQRAPSGEHQFRAVLIDNSASMGLQQDGREQFDAARAAARQLLNELGAEAQIEVAFFNDRVEPVTESVRESRSGIGGRRKLHEAIESGELSYAVTDYAAALRWAGDMCTQSAAVAKHVHMFTDLQRSGLEWSESTAVPRDVVFHIHDVGQIAANNIAVCSATPSRLVVRPGEAVVVESAIQNDGPFTLNDVPVVLELRYVNRPVRVEQRVTLASGAIENVRFESPPLPVGLWRGTVSVEAIDDLAVDNVRHLAVMSAPPWRVLLVDGDPHASPFLSETYFVDLALRLARPDEHLQASPYATETIVAAVDPWPNLAAYSVVVLANVPELAHVDIVRLTQFVRDGGGLIVFAGDKLSPERYEALAEAGLVPGAIGENRLAGDLPLRITNWDQKHSIFMPFEDPQHGDLQSLTFRCCTPIEPAKMSSVVARFNDMTPALVEQPLGKGRVIWFGSACDLAWSDWPRSSLFVPLVHRMLGGLTGLNEGGPVRMAVARGGGERDAGVQKPGVVQLNSHWLVVNIDPRESEIARCTEADFTNRFGIDIERDDSNSAAIRTSSGLTKYEFRQIEFWYWVIVALVGLAATEFLVANRVTA